MSASEKVSQIPASGFDMARPELFANEDVLDMFKVLREEDPMHYAENEHFGPMWHVTRYEIASRSIPTISGFPHPMFMAAFKLMTRSHAHLSKVSKFPLLSPKTNPMRPFANRCSRLPRRPHGQFSRFDLAAHGQCVG